MACFALGDDLPTLMTGIWRVSHRRPRLRNDLRSSATLWPNIWPRKACSRDMRRHAIASGLHGCRLWSDVQASGTSIIEHDKQGSLHRVTLAPDTRLAALVRAPQCPSIRCIGSGGELSSSVIASAHSDDGVIEAIEIPAHPFALGVQWHQEQLVAAKHPGNQIFQGFVKACY